MIIVGVYNEVNKSNYHIVVNVVSKGVPKECSNTDKTRRCMVIKKNWQDIQGGGISPKRPTLTSACNSETQRLSMHGVLEADGARNPATSN